MCIAEFLIDAQSEIENAGVRVKLEVLALCAVLFGGGDRIACLVATVSDT